VIEKSGAEKLFRTVGCNRVGRDKPAWLNETSVVGKAGPRCYLAPKFSCGDSIAINTTQRLGLDCLLQR